MDFAAIVIVGSTASGKSELAHTLFQLSQKWERPLRIVNTDAFQIYKGMDIGTAKPSLTEQKEFHYAGIDLLNPSESMDVQQFATRVSSICSGLWRHGKMPILVGGSGLYLRGILHGLSELPDRDESIRSFLKGLAEAKGWPHLHKVLGCIDPKRASEVHPNDKVRIERAIEICLLSGRPMSSFMGKTEELNKQETLFPACVIHVQRDSDELKSRISLRVQQMLQQGWLEEVGHLVNEYGEGIVESQAFKAIGYVELYHALKEVNFERLKITDSDFAALADKITTLTWQYAKRQKTWNAKEVCHYTYQPGTDQAERLLELILQFQVSFMKKGVL